MPIKIPKPSNKTENHTKNEYHHEGQEGDDSCKNAKLIPFIDKISLVWEPTSDQHADLIHSNIWHQTKDPEWFQPSSSPANKAGGFKRAYRIKTSVEEHWPLFQYKYTDKRAEKFRLELNPHKIGEHGFVRLHAALQSILPTGLPYFVDHGRITRIDVAVDLIGLDMDQFLPLVHQGMWNKAFGIGGHLQTLCLGKPRGNYTQIYDKQAERIAKGEQWPEKTVRVERRLRNQKVKKLTDLLTMENPFAMLVLTQHMPPPPLEEKEWHWAMFQDSVQVRGITAALALLPLPRRARYRKHLESHPHPCWDPDAIWLNWPKAVAPLLQDWV